MQLVADRSGLGIERRRLDEAERRARIDAERGRRYAVVLAAASAVLASAREDYHANLASLVDAVVPNFSDWCAIDILNDVRDLERLSIRHVIDQGELCSAELRQRIPTIDALLIRTIEKQQTQHSSGFLAGTAIRGQRQPAAVTDPTPWIVVPLITGTGVIGTVFFAFDGGASDHQCRHGRHRRGHCSARAAVAIDRVLFYQESQEIAEHSSRVAGATPTAAPDALLEIARLVDDSGVVSAIAGRALSI